MLFADSAETLSMQLRLEEKPKRDLRKIPLRFDENFLEKIDSFAEKLGLSRQRFIFSILKQVIDEGVTLKQKIRSK